MIWCRHFVVTTVSFIIYYYCHFPALCRLFLYLMSSPNYFKLQFHFALLFFRSHLTPLAFAALSLCALSFSPRAVTCTPLSPSTAQ